MDDRSVSQGITPPQRRWRRMIAPIAVAAVLIAWGMFLAGQFDSLRSYAWQIAPAALLASVALSALYYGGLALCWSLLLRSMAAQPVAHPAAVRIWLLSMISRYIPGNVWHILSRALMADRLGVSRTTVVASASIEQLLTLLAAFGIAALTLPVWQLRNTLASDLPFGEILIAAVAIGLLGLHPRMLGAALAWAGRRFGRRDLLWSYRYRDILRIVAVSVAAQLGSGLALAAVIAGISGIAPADLLPITGAAALAWALGYLSFLTPSGLGVREGVLTALLLLVVPLPVATIASLLYRVALTLGELLAVLLAWFLRRSG
ncbi:MAG TPA: lysylphosphatidylglycerol synthase domain-containing protein [Roseiflexaceae bacterium]|nr:lysylphosphatidylglycerol synthase domain-containing protein [Roseiflexaceae bacterium]